VQIPAQSTATDSAMASKHLCCLGFMQRCGFTSPLDLHERKSALVPVIQREKRMLSPRCATQLALAEEPKSLFNSPSGEPCNAAVSQQHLTSNATREDTELLKVQSSSCAWMLHAAARNSSLLWINPRKRCSFTDALLAEALSKLSEQKHKISPSGPSSLHGQCS